MNVDSQQSRHAVRDPGDVGEARRTIVSRASALGWNESDQGRAALLATEAATNIIKHAARGEIVIGTAGACIELLALDRGPGMPDVDRCMQDGYSTAGSAGTGLGALRRIADVLDVYSAPRLGTALLARLSTSTAPAAGEPRTRTGAVCLAVAGEQKCGDQWHRIVGADRSMVLVADGLGHGGPAFEASSSAVRVFAEHADEAADALLARLHDALRSTRGAAAAIAQIMPAQHQLRYAGVGNISASIVSSDASRSLVSQNGTLGVGPSRVRSYEYPWSRDATLVMHSDGVNTRWNLQQYPGLLMRDPSLIAGVLYRDFARGKDDVCVVVVRDERDAEAAQ
jgi:anti-sigma regulatory factor (Ser/Thr protein kinase)